MFCDNRKMVTLMLYCYTRVFVQSISTLPCRKQWQVGWSLFRSSLMENNDKLVGAYSDPTIWKIVKSWLELILTILYGKQWQGDQSLFCPSRMRYSNNQLYSVYQITSILNFFFQNSVFVQFLFFIQFLYSYCNGGIY